MSRLLLLEDDPLLSQTLLSLLHSEGFEVMHASDGEEALEIAYEYTCDLYLLDINVPRLNGIDFLKALRESGDRTPAFFISALKDIATITKAFDSLCDDYIKKPFDFDELLVRIRAHITKKNPTVLYGQMQYDLQTQRLFFEEKEVDLGSVDKAILDIFVRNLGQLIYKEQLFDVMEKATDLALRVHIAKLKKRLGLHLTNVKGIGYRLEKL